MPQNHFRLYIDTVQIQWPVVTDYCHFSCHLSQLKFSFFPHSRTKICAHKICLLSICFKSLRSFIHDKRYQDLLSLFEIMKLLLGCQLLFMASANVLQEVEVRWVLIQVVICFEVGGDMLIYNINRIATLLSSPLPSTKKITCFL